MANLPGDSGTFGSAKLFTFEVHTPYRRFFSGQIEALSITLMDGEIGVYAQHSAFTAPVETCIMRIKDKTGVWRNAFTTEGILEVKEHKTVLMVDDAEWPAEIDHERAEAAKKRAEESLAGGLLTFEAVNVTASLKRAEFRLKAWEMRDLK
jgi:F-type H+-transporting ATPase subunit epsilon